MKSMGTLPRSASRRSRRLVAHRICCSTLAQEHIVRGVGRAGEGAGLVARPFKLSTPGIDPLHCRDAREDSTAAPGNHLKLQPGNIVRRRTGNVANSLADHGAAIVVLPARSGIVTADGLAIEQ